MTDVEAIVVTHNPGAYLDPCIESLDAQIGAAATLLIDTGSTDGSVERVATRFAHLRTLETENLGFAHANNVGIRETDAPFVLLLNPDAELGPGVVSRLLEYASEHADTGIVCPLVTNADGSVQYGSYGRYPSFVERARLAVWRLAQKLRGNATLSPARPDAPADVPWATGAAMLVRRAAIEDAGPMDDGFFLYYEDIDWCHRMNDAGWRVVVVPDVEVVHHLGKSGAGGMSAAYRKSFERYTRKYGLTGLRFAGGLAARLRRLFGGAA